MTEFTHPFYQVKEFHDTFSITSRTTPTLPGQDERELRKRLLTEEYEEYLQAEAEDDIVEIGDALGDIIYICAGTALAYGIPLDVIFNEIHRSNMSKLDENGNVLRRADGKIIKSALFEPPRIEEILRKHRG